MKLDLRIKNAHIASEENTVDIGITDGKIVSIQPSTKITKGEKVTASKIIDAENQFVCSGFYESHIHLDKACILDRCTIEEGTLEEAVSETSNAKKKFTEADVFERASKVVEMAIKRGTMGLRTFVETDPKTDLRSFNALKKVREKYAFAMDIEICAFAQEGLTDEMETYTLLEKALQQGADLVGGCPYKDNDPKKHIALIFDLAAKYKVPVDFHLDFDLDPENSDIPEIARQTLAHKYQGKVSIGHVTKLSAMKPTQRHKMSTLLKEAEIALTVLPATDVFLNGRDSETLIPRGMVNANQLAEKGILTTISSNNILNAFTPFGDANLLRMANMYANIAQLSKDAELEIVFEMITKNAAKLLSIETEIKLGAAANLVILEATDAVEAIRTNAQALIGFKNGLQTFCNKKAEIFF